MMRSLLALALALCALCAHAVPSDAVFAKLAEDDSDSRIEAINALAADGSEQSIKVLDALADGTLYVTAEGALVILTDTEAIDPRTGQSVTYPESSDQIYLNNRLRGVLQGALAASRVKSPDREVRLAAANELRENASEDMLPLIESALATEKDKAVRNALRLAAARIDIASTDSGRRRKAAENLGESADASVKFMLAGLLKKADDGHFVEADEAVRTAAQDSIDRIDRRLAMADVANTLFSGISLGSILLLAALGLAITYGVMGVINMAHGELLMVGAYATYVVQGLFRAYLPDHQDLYVLAAVPVAFFTAAVVGMVMERTVIRWLYGRTLETLLATWGLSLILIQAARVIFGPQNQEVSNPAWMSGGVEVFANVILPWNRIVIIAFAAFVLLLVWLMMQKTRLGMFVRAVTQNRAMAGCVGVPTARIDTLAFGIGAGIAGLGGCALSQVANVGPAMGQGYIVDSFMVVVLGGVGQLAGAVTAGLGLGLMTKFLEGWSGAVVAKILVLVFIIIFIQKRPQGLFAVKGRFVED
ncbi:urea ABC transporter permease subunit UrtB [Nitrogeniibacter mangrovi]|uniref:Urea ABC transporter permease subunit UrtB n=1 Tax=Nitrogeniibacter mangrovi TaxID=2016596 RepID=A0A6C1B1E6_9RHOO|nr:urea ABC transporter permease subunit UrtB [Nitrogeniibacter mangrovi]QID17432.1 urea ABC transporter permease subunit UrtB [Nitrogeniibacter mangrovi]